MTTTTTTTSLPPLLQSPDAMEPLMNPPVKIKDPYAWMRSNNNNNHPSSSSSSLHPKVLQQIQNENEYTLECTRHLKPLQQTLQREYYNSIYSQQSQGKTNNNTTTESSNDDIANIYSLGDYYYYTRRLPDQSLPLHCRIPRKHALAFFQDINGPNTNNNNNNHWKRHQDSVLLDENQVAKDLNASSSQGYFGMHSVAFHPKFEDVAIFSVDTRGDEQYSIYAVVHLDDDDDDDDDDEKNNHKKYVLIATNTSGTIHLFEQQDGGGVVVHFVELDSQLRPFKWMEWRGNPTLGLKKSQTRTIIFQEDNCRFWGDLETSLDGQYLLWTTHNSLTPMETLAWNRATRELVMLSRRKSQLGQNKSGIMAASTFQHGHGGSWWVLSNHENNPTSFNNLELYTFKGGGSADDVDPSNWHLVEWKNRIDNTSDISLDRVLPFPEHIVLQGRQDGMRRIWVLWVDPDNHQSIYKVESLSFEESAHYISLASKQDYYSGHLLITYESMITPPRVVEVELKETSRRRVIHAPQIPGYLPETLACHCIMVRSRDGRTEIPISVVHKKGVPFPAPLHLMGYGAYGHSLEPSFSSIRLPLLNRGVVCVVAHVRGGGEMGPSWTHAGRQRNKMNSINDFVDVAQWLVDNEWTNRNMLAAEGRSAGGLLVAAGTNQSPDLFRTVILGVPFLDVLVSMSDPTLPLTVMEWDEWGNPNEASSFDVIRSYAPIQNIQANKSYPNMLLIGGLYDPRVPYWEPLKYASELRHQQNMTMRDEDDRSMICVKIDTSAGHSFGGNRDKYFEELAWLYAFVLDQIDNNNDSK